MYGYCIAISITVKLGCPKYLEKEMCPKKIAHTTYQINKNSAIEANIVSGIINPLLSIVFFATGLTTHLLTFLDFIIPYALFMDKA